MPQLCPVQTNFSKALFYWTLTTWYASVIFHFSAMSNPVAGLPVSIGVTIAQVEASGFDKVLHFLEFAGFGFLLYKAMRTTFGRLPVFRIALIVLLAAGLYAISDEFHQSFVPGRDACAADAVADHIGILVGVGASLL
jgi:hypothetical protein